MGLLRKSICLVFAVLAAVCFAEGGVSENCDFPSLLGAPTQPSSRRRVPPQSVGAFEMTSLMRQPDMVRSQTHSRPQDMMEAQRIDGEHAVSGVVGNHRFSLAVRPEVEFGDFIYQLQLEVFTPDPTFLEHEGEIGLTFTRFKKGGQQIGNDSEGSAASRPVFLMPMMRPGMLRAEGAKVTLYHRVHRGNLELFVVTKLNIEPTAERGQVRPPRVRGYWFRLPGSSY